MGNVNKANSAANEREERPKEASFSVFSLENQTEQLPQHRVLLKDASPQNLQNLFELHSPPRVLKGEDGTCIFHRASGDIEASTWSTELRKDGHYKVVVPTAKEAVQDQIQIPATLKSWDIHCAIVCSQATQLCGYGEDESKLEEVKTIFRESDVGKHVDVICPSIYGDVRYLLARSTKQGVLYVAFGGEDDFRTMVASPTLVDTELCMKSDGEPRPLSGKCNEFIWRQCKTIPVELIQGKCLQSDIKRIVTCGHGIGGAIANVFALRLQLRFGLLKGSPSSSDNTFSPPEVFSITFGAPMSISKDLVEDVGYPDNFFNIVNIQDPVPTVLEYGSGVANPPPYVPRTVMNEIKASFADVLDRMAKVLKDEHINQEEGDDVDVATTEFYRVVQKAFSLDPDMTQRIISNCKEKNIPFMEIIQCPFHPIGWYIFCCPKEEYDPGTERNNAVFEEYRVDGSAKVERFGNLDVCYVRKADVIGKLLAKPKIEESVVPQHSISAYFKMVSQSITRNSRVNIPRENDEVEKPAHSSPQSTSIRIEFPAEARIRLKKRRRFFWSRMFTKEIYLEMVIEGKNLGFFTLRHSNFSRLPLTNGSKLQIKHLSAEKIELVGEFDPKKSVYKRPSVDLATHFQTIRITTDEDQIKEIEAKTLADSLVDGLNPMLLLRAWHRGVTSVILTESESREDELQQNRLLSQLYKLEKNSMQSQKPLLQAYTRAAVSKGFYALGEPDPELLHILAKITESFGQNLVIEFSLKQRALSVAYSALLTLGAFVAIYTSLAGLKSGEKALKMYGAVFGKREAPRFRDFLATARMWIDQEVKELKYDQLKVRFNQIEDNYLSMLCTYISELRDVNNPGIDSEDKTAGIFELEETLCAKYRALGFDGKNVEETLKKDPFKKEKIAADAKDSSKRNILRRIQQSCDLFQLRQYLKEEGYIGVVGPQDAGKSTLIKQLWGLDVGVIGYTSHTNKAKVYQVPGASKVKVLDFPGSTSIDDYMANVIRECGGMASFLILVMPYVGDVSRIHKDEFANTEGFQLPTLVCINKCAMYLRQSEDFDSVESVSRARKRYAEALKVNVEDVLFTDFLECSELMRAKGDAGISEVKDWIETKLIELDLYKEGDEELNHALNKPHDCALQQDTCDIEVSSTVPDSVQVTVYM